MEKNSVEYILKRAPQIKNYFNEWNEGRRDADINAKYGFLSLSVIEILSSKEIEPSILKDLFLALEEILKTADEELRGIIEVHFFEGILNYFANKKKSINEIKEYLGPISIELCKNNEQAWGANIIGL